MERQRQPGLSDQEIRVRCCTWYGDIVPLHIEEQKNLKRRKNRLLKDTNKLCTIFQCLWLVKAWWTCILAGMSGCLQSMLSSILNLTFHAASEYPFVFKYNYINGMHVRFPIVMVLRIMSTGRGQGRNDLLIQTKTELLLCESNTMILSNNLS